MKNKITDTTRLDTLLGIIRGGAGYVPAVWTTPSGVLTGVNIKTRRDIDICVKAILASQRKPK